MATLTRGEILRKTVHMAVGSIALLLRFLGPLWSAVLALAAVVFNAAILPRLGGRALFREADARRGHAVGIVLYPVTVLLLIVVFHRQLEVAAAIWGILALGDGTASLFGMAFGRRKLPWNPVKSWIGSGAHLVFGGLAAWGLLLWTAPPGRYGVGFAFAAAFAAALLATILESMPQGLDDNLGVPLVTGLFLGGLLLTAGSWTAFPDAEFLRRLAIGAGVNVVLALLGYAARGVNRSGMLAGFVVGTLIFAFLDWRGYVVLLLFFVLGTAATKVGYARKAAAKLAQEEGGRRGAKHALANTSVAAACALFAAMTPYPLAFALAFAAAFATKSSDTVSSEIGQLWGRRTFLITTLRPVPRGTQGAVSVEGTVAGILASAIVGAVGFAVGLYPVAGIAAVIVAAFVGTTLESLIGATLERRGLLDNEAVNFLNTLVGAVVAAALTPLVA